MSAPVLIGCAHGTREPAGQATIRNLLEEVRLATALEVREAYVDVHGPTIGEVVASVGRDQPLGAVVVPLLLAGGYHVYVDIAQATENRSDVRAAPALGPDPRLVEIVVQRLREASVPDGTRLVFAAAGSSDPRSQADTDAAAGLLRQRWSGRVDIAFAAGHPPSVADTVARARAEGDAPVAVASYLLAPGVFQQRLEQAGADYVTAPLAPHPLLVDIVAERFRDQLTA